MLKKEKELFLQLCDLKNCDKKKIEQLLNAHAATAEVLGTLFENRMAAIAYSVLNKVGLLDKVGREFRNSLHSAYLMNINRNSDYFKCLREISDVLDSCGAPYALLKGAYLCGWYPDGCRTSNDIDVLISPEDVGLFSNCLRNAGYKQGSVKNNKFVPATRKEIIESKMTRGETVPFIKKVDLPSMTYLEIDLNFSLDYKNSDDKLLKDMLDRAVRIGQCGVNIRTLDKYDFILHLCEHLYKEATTMPWIDMRRDMTFYKYCDIYSILSEFSAQESSALIDRANECGAGRELKYCLYSLMSFYSNFGTRLKKYVDESEVGLFNYVVSPAEKCEYRYTESSPVRRFFSSNRVKLLEVL